MPKRAEDKVNRMLACMDKIVEAHWVTTAQKSEVTASPSWRASRSSSRGWSPSPPRSRATDRPARRRRSTHTTG